MDDSFGRLYKILLYSSHIKKKNKKLKHGEGTARPFIFPDSLHVFFNAALFASTVS